MSIVKCSQCGNRHDIWDECDTVVFGPLYDAGDWSRRNLEAFLADQVPIPAPVIKSYCYSNDEERYHGNYMSEWDAIQEATNEYEGGGFWIAEIDYPSDFLNPYFVGENIAEHMSEMLHDKVGEVSECFSLTRERKIEIGKAVIAMIDKSPGFSCFGVKNIRRIDPQ